jgi:SSS family solute:Na+ symporter
VLRETNEDAIMNWLLFWICIYLLVIVFFTIRHVKPKDPENYLVNNRKTKLLPLVVTILATFVGGGTSIGLIAMGYESGFAAIGIGIAYVIGFMLMMRYAGKIRDFGAANRIYSFPQYLSQRFTKNRTTLFKRSFSTVVNGVNIFIFFFLLAAQFVGMASLLRFGFDIGYQHAVVISAVIIILYTALAGLSGVIFTDMIQFVAIVIMIIFIFIPGVYNDTAQLSRLTELPEEMLNGTFYGYTFLIGLLLFLSPSVLVRMDIWQRMLAAKDAATARKASLWSGIGMLPFYIIFPLVGMSVRISISPDLNPNDTTYFFLAAHGTEFFTAFAVTGLLAALMSSGDSFLNIVSISAVRDFTGWRKIENPDPSTTQTWIRLVTVIFGILALFIALSFPYIVDLMVVGIGTIVIFVPVTVLALTHKDPHHYARAALISIFFGFAVNTSFFIFGVLSPELFEPKSSFIPAFIVSSLALVIAMKFSKPKTA